jgi:hypothetical protein
MIIFIKNQDSFQEGIDSARLDTKAKCKTGKPCGDRCIPKTSKCRSNGNALSSPVSEHSPSLPLPKNAAIAAGIATAVTAASLAAIMGINHLDKKYQISDHAAKLVANYTYNELNKYKDIDQDIDKLPIDDERKESLKGLAGRTKIFALKTLFDGSGEFVSDNKDLNFVTVKRNNGNLISFGSVGSKVITFGSERDSFSAKNFPIYEMGFQVNGGFGAEAKTQSREDQKKNLKLLRIAQTAFEDHIKHLPENVILTCSAYQEDSEAKGSKRQSLYEKKGFVSLGANGLRGKQLWALKNQGIFTSIPEKQKDHVASLIRGDSKREDSKYMAELAKNIEKRQRKRSNKTDSISYKKGYINAIAELSASV